MTPADLRPPPLALWLPLVSLPPILFVALAPARWFGEDPSTGFVYAVIGLTGVGVAQAALSIFAPDWIRFSVIAVAAHAVVFMLLLIIGVAGPLRDTGPAGMVMLLPMLFPTLALGAAAVVRAIVALARSLM